MASVHIWALGSSARFSTIAFFRMDTLATAARLPSKWSSSCPSLVAFAIKAPMVPVRLAADGRVARPGVRAAGRRVLD